MHMNINKQYVVSEQDIVTGWLSGNNVTDVIVEDTKPINIYNCLLYTSPSPRD